MLTGPLKPVSENPAPNDLVVVSTKVHEPTALVTAEVSILKALLNVTDPAPVTLFAVEFNTTNFIPPFTISEPPETVVVPV